MIEITLRNLIETEKFGKILADICGPGTLICLNGDLGAGKTTLTQFIGKNLDVKEYINSPSYSLMNTYNGKFTIHHYDLYKLEGVDEVLDIGIEDYLYSKDIIIIEWAEKIEDILPNERIDMTIKTFNTSRKVIISGNGKYFLNLKKELKENDCFRN